jgi:hypothetical protein
MLSLANTYSIEEVEDFVQRVYKLLEKKKRSFARNLKWMEWLSLSAMKKESMFELLRVETGKKGTISPAICVRSTPFLLSFQVLIFPMF